MPPAGHAGARENAMKGRGRLKAGGLVLLSITLLHPPPARAQFTADFQTNTISGVTSNWVGQPFYIVGSNTMGDVLQIINSGVLSNSGAVIGDRIEASNNTAIVSG